MLPCYFFIIYSRLVSRYLYRSPRMCVARVCVSVSLFSLVTIAVTIAVIWLYLRMPSTAEALMWVFFLNNFNNQFHRFIVCSSFPSTVNLWQLFCRKNEFKPLFSWFFGYSIIFIFTPNEYINKQYNWIVSHESHDKYLFLYFSSFLFFPVLVLHFTRRFFFRISLSILRYVCA